MTLADEITKLTDLRDRGALTAGEFERAKSQLLASSDPGSPIKTVKMPPKNLNEMVNHLARSMQDRVFGGVCGGLAAETRLPSWLWRCLFCIAFLCAGIGLIPYLLLWVFMPSAEADNE